MGLTRRASRNRDHSLLGGKLDVIFRIAAQFLQGRHGRLRYGADLPQRTRRGGADGGAVIVQALG